MLVLQGLAPNLDPQPFEDPKPKSFWKPSANLLGAFQSFWKPSGKLQRSKIELKMSKNGFQLDASDWENLALRLAPAALQNLGVSQSGRHSTFKELFRAV